MKHRLLILFFLLTLIFPICVFSQQASALRDYVGLISRSYHPDIVAYFEKNKAEFAKRGETDAVKAIEIFLRGDVGSGFVYSDARGNLYVITNNHVISQAHNLSITFERQDGSKRKFENLKIIAIDEELDLALLAFAPADKPVARGLSFLTRQVQEGDDVYSAGFPALGTTPIWQFGRGMVSNVSARFPKSNEDDTLMGPFIQHTAEVDPGNSGGPLLILQQNAPSGYAVAGVNTLKATRRQATNYAIPISTIQPFLNNALNQRPETFRAALDKRIESFIEGLGVNRAVYPHIAEYLSPNCVGENAEYAMIEMYEKGNASLRRAFVNKCEESIVGAMGFAVAWTIENSMRGRKTGAIKASVKEITGSGEEYTVVFSINDIDHNSTWVWEYGNWRIRSFGTVAEGNKALVAKKESRRLAKEKLRLDSNFHIEAGYAYLFEKAPAALYFAGEFEFFGVRAYFVDSDYFAIGMFGGYRYEIPLENIAFIPYIRVGIDYHHDKEYVDLFNNVSADAGFPLAFNFQAGLKITTAYVPGLFFGTAFQYNFFDMYGKDYDNIMKMALSISVGYAF